MSRLKEKYQKEISKLLAKEFSIKNPMAIPKMEKVVINCGIGEAATKKEIIEQVSRDLAAITGQKPSVRRARISVAGFGLRAGAPVGLAVTLRGERMWGFLDKLFSIVLPRLRDFKGIPLKGFDKSGNYTLGIAEYTVFLEVDVTKVDRSGGLEITIVTTAKTPFVAKRLLEELGAPFEKQVASKSQS